MKCNRCHAQWNISAAMSASVTVCPFCGADLYPRAEEKPESMAAVLKIIIDHGGVDALRDSRRSLALFSDLAPDLRKERTLYAHLVQCGGNTLLLDALGKARPQQIAARSMVIQRLTEEIMLSEAAAIQACDSFWEAIGGQPFPSGDPVSDTIPAPRPGVQPPAPESPVQTILSPLDTLHARVHHRMIACGWDFVAGLDVTGRVHLAGSVPPTLQAVQTWTDIVAIAAGYYHVVGLKADGTVCAAGYNEFGQCNVPGWFGVTAIAAGPDYTIGLKTDGTVVFTGYNGKQKYDFTRWQDVVSISAAFDHAVGLKADGTVVAAGTNEFGECNVDGWNRIAQVCALWKGTIGLKQDGTLIFAGDPDCHFPQLSQWKHIVSLSAKYTHAAALTTTGDMVAAGADPGCCNVAHWNEILTVCAGVNFTAGLKMNGSVVIADKDWPAVTDWRLFTSPERLDAWLTTVEARKQEWIARAEERKRLNTEYATLTKELNSLSRLFGGQRRSEIQRRLSEIEAALQAMRS